MFNRNETRLSLPAVINVDLVEMWLHCEKTGDKQKDKTVNNHIDWAHLRLTEVQKVSKQIH